MGHITSSRWVTLDLFTSDVTYRPNYVENNGMSYV